MVLYTPHAHGSRPKAGTREPRDSSIALVTDDVYCILTDRETLGFVHKVGNVYVALSGDVLSHAVEIGQTLSWDRAVEMVRHP
jgi:hypothetical protein